MASVEQELALRLARGEEVVLATVIRTDGEPPSRAGAKLLLTRTASLAGTLGCSEFDSAAQADARATAEAGQPVLRTYQHDLGSIEVYLEPHSPRPLLVVLAATPVARQLLDWAPQLGFATLFVETNPERLSDGDWPSAVADLADLGRKLGSDFYCVHTDHDAPDLVDALAILVEHEPRFIGIMGSARHTGHHLDSLAERGVAPDVIARIQSPVGLDLGAQTPAEVALSILAGVVAKRHQAVGGWKQDRRA